MDVFGFVVPAIEEVCGKLVLFGTAFDVIGSAVGVTIVDGETVRIAPADVGFVVPVSEEVCAKLVLFGRAVDVVGFERVVVEGVPTTVDADTVGTD